MMNAEEEHSPDMLAVLEEVQKSPRSHLFRRPRHFHQGGFGSEPITGGEPFLSSAERKLVRAHRESLEEYLKCKGRLSFVRGTTWASSFTSLDPVEEYTASQGDVFTGDSSTERIRWGGGNYQTVVRIPSISTSKTFNLLYSAQQLIPRASTMTFMGFAAAEAGHTREGLEYLNRVYHGEFPTIQKPFATGGVGLVYWKVRDYLSAAIAYKRPCQSAELKPELAIFTLTSAAYAGAWRLVSLAQEQISRVGGSEPSYRASMSRFLERNKVTKDLDLPKGFRLTDTAATYLTALGAKF